MKGTWKKGEVVLDGPVDWPEGCRLRVKPVSEEGSLEIQEDGRPESPEEIAKWLKEFDALEPIDMTPEEEADLAAWRQQIKEYTIAKMNKRIEGLFD